MKSLRVITVSPGLSGAGLLSDFFLSRKDFISPFKNFPNEDQQSEFRFISDPGGLNSLYEGFYKNFSINNSAYVFNEFNIYLKKLKKLRIIKNNRKVYLYNKAFFREAEIFKKKIIKLSYYGLPQFYRLGLNKKEKFIWKISNRFKTAQDTKFFKMVIPVDEKKFIKESRKFIDKILFVLSGKINKNYIIDQGTNFWKPEISRIFFPNCKIILVTRDPRSIFSSMKKRQSLSFPGHSVDIFVKWYNLIMKDFSKKSKLKNSITIKYEKFILDHDFERSKLLKFVKLKDLKSKNFNVNNSKKNIFKAKLYLTKRELNIIEKKLKKYLQWPKKTYI
tara:strand:- start:275 stop:1276 length:1002 start_codon:yes stop_codon:yes gene_type:complete